MLGEAHLEGDIQGHGVLVLSENLDYCDRLLHGFVRTGKGQGAHRMYGRVRGGGLVVVSLGGSKKFRYDDCVVHVHPK